MTRNDTAGDLEEIVTHTLNDVQNLECQIRNLLRSMDVVDNIASASILELPERLTLEGKDAPPPTTRMQWRDDSKKQKKGKNISESKTTYVSDVRDYAMDEGLEHLSGLDIMEMCINENANKYEPLKDSMFFVPVLDKCVFGITLLNSAITNLRKPKISLSLLHPSGSSTDEQCPRKPLCRCFLYDVQVSLTEVNIERGDSAKTKQGLAYQESFSNYLDLREQVMPGCEVLVTATFAYPFQFLGNGNEFSLLLSVNLDGKELWAREVPITSNCFTASSIDQVFKIHHSSIMAAIASEHELFKIERLLSHNELTPYKSMERFLVSLGYEAIQSVRTGTDTTIEVYTTHQPSFVWGTCFKMEKCSGKPSLTRCLVTARNKDQMQYIFTQFQCWLKKEREKDKRLGLSGITVTPINPRSNLTVCEKLQAEIDLMIKFQQVKSILRKERESGRTQRRKTDRCNDNGSIDSSWVHEYSICVERTDITFVDRKIKEQ